MKWINQLLNKESTSIKETIGELKKSSDFMFVENDTTTIPYSLVYFSSLVDHNIINRDILPTLTNLKDKDIRKSIPIQDIVKTNSSKEVSKKLLEGYLLVAIDGSIEDVFLIKVQKDEKRNISTPEVEFSVVGPKEAFVESLETNIHLVRKRLPIKELIVEELKIGKLSNSSVAILYIDGIVDMENVNTMRQRLEDIDIDFISDSSYIAQIISDNELSPFPQVLDSERPDRISAVLAEGKVVVMVDDSPHALIAPTTFVEFFSSFEDYLFNWYVSSFIRILRVFAVFFSILITPLYVAALTYHYELIPKDLLATLITSRREIPLPPILEALFLELTIELLREAGARLPTKVGQTIGIVGGIVIGTASVEAGLTSNVLLIIVALAALASFSTPIYKMGNTIRLIRFPFLVFAHAWGLIGIVICFCFLITHLLRLTSLGRPFLEPIYPLRVSDLRDAFIRLPFSQLGKRPQQLRPKTSIRFSPKDAKMKRDIDE
ncbi:spore germination protein [Bacillus pinisoli]|uniref:spore germination protein n=1 Tax=Bacillus pinisoli TaxID=2901866 RepID=UPI001FF68012|nr:spore germination protein [Bacillus pinisoli]